MDSESPLHANVKKAVPFFMVKDMKESLKFYIDGLGFMMKGHWIPKDKIEWCWLENGNAAMMLQEYRKEAHGSYVPKGKPGEGVSICFICEDALAIYRDAVTKRLEVSEPFVGNGYWVVDFVDPDGYRLEFESATNVPEETKYSDWLREQTDDKII